MRYFYSILFYLALPFIILRLIWRSRTHKQNPRYLERLGFCPHRLDKCIWIHAVSLGETIAAIPLIKKLQQFYSEIPILVTNMTATGSQQVKKSLGNSVLNAYVPYDIPDAVNRFLQRVNPMIAIMMETELWPNVFYYCHKKNIPVIVTNARLSEKSFSGYQRVKYFISDLWKTIYALAVQNEKDAMRFMQLGVPKEKISITGSIKFDVEINPDWNEQGAVLRKQWGNERLLWIAASTHRGEDEIILMAHQKILEKFPQALLILVPRHPERFDEIAALIDKNRFSFSRRSLDPGKNKEITVYLGDTLGELMMMYAASDAAFVGGSLVATGGHNLVEPAMLGKPILSGPQLFNFSEISSMLASEGGMMIVRDAEEISEAIIKLFSDEKYAKDMGNNAYHVVEKNRGALQKQLEVINNAMYKL